MNLPDGPSVVSINPAASEEAKLALISLLGTTLAELKNIDSNVVGSSLNIKANKTDINKILNDSGFITQNTPPKILTQQPQQINIHPQPVVQETVSHSQNISTEDPNQLVFDFNQKITPETIDNKLNIIIEKLNKIIDIVS